MINLTKIIDNQAEARTECASLTLDYERRQRSRQRIRLDDGRDAVLRLPRGSTLRDGIRLGDDRGNIVLVRAAPEAVSSVRVADPFAFARAAYHLGNRHEAVQLGDGWLRYRRDPVLDAMLRGLGFAPEHELAPFEPERGAYHQGIAISTAVESPEPATVAVSEIPAPSHDCSGSMPEAIMPRPLLQLLRLASPALPIGSFAYSQGLEYAVERGWVTDEDSTAEWLSGLLEHVQVHQDLPIFARLYRAWTEHDHDRASYWNDCLIAMRDTAELRGEERDVGNALGRLLTGLDVIGADRDGHGYVSMFACAAARWDIALPAAAGGMLWSWCQNQVAAAVRLVPLGQTAGQRILQRLIAEIPERVERGLGLDDDAIGFSAPGLAIASTQHERQYTRLFLS